MADWDWDTSFPVIYHRLKEYENDGSPISQETLLRQIENCIINNGPLPRFLDRNSPTTVIQKPDSSEKLGKDDGLLEPEGSSEPNPSHD